MTTPFASGYAPINLLNDAIQRQAAMGQAGYLDAQKINEAAISDSLNRAVQQRALQQQAAAQQQHYGLQQQQLANDLAYRNQAQGEAKRQFDLQYELNKAISDANIAQMNKPGYGMGKDFGLGVFQGAQDVAAHNAAATAVASQASGALAAARQAYKADVSQINDPNWYEAIGRKLPLFKTKEDLLNAAKAKFDANYSKILSDLGPHRDKVSFTGAPEVNGEFQPVLLTPPSMPGMPAPQQTQPQVQTPEAAAPNQSAPGGAFVPDFGGSAPAQSGNPFLSSPFMQQIMTGKPTATGPVQAAPVTIPTGGNRILRWVPGQGLIPVQ